MLYPLLRAGEALNSGSRMRLTWSKDWAMVSRSPFERALRVLPTCSSEEESVTDVSDVELKSLMGVDLLDPVRAWKMVGKAHCGLRRVVIT